MMTENTDYFEELGVLVDELDSLIAATKLPIPASSHLSALHVALPDLLEKMRSIVISATGENPWEESWL